MEINKIDYEIKIVKEILKSFPVTTVTDMWFDKRYKALENYEKLLKEHKELQIKYENTKRELITRTDMLIK